MLLMGRDGMRSKRSRGPRRPRPGQVSLKLTFGELKLTNSVAGTNGGSSVDEKPQDWQNVEGHRIT